ncbi:uncharacterized protein UHOR_13548 [Ustilago hordei]|uniref:Uncharacterized protein n=2 Tax=Ustilago hordei TaxID=120017 RepID=I2FQD1_USTHO|nr:uncharacterized protein UHOR_13548 [Ustilago hordei]
MKEEAAIGNDLLMNLTKHTICNSKSKTVRTNSPPSATHAGLDTPSKSDRTPALVATSRCAAKPAWPWQEAAENCTLEPMLDLPELLPTIHEESMPIQTLCEDPQHAHIFKWIHLGVWHDQAYQRLQLTADTLQNNGTHTAREAVGKFSEWLQHYTTKHVSPLVAGNQIKTGLCDEFAAILHQQESIHYPWVKEHVAGYDKFCHPLYLTFVPFRGFTIGDHTDMADSAISILLNFGQHAVLELPDYNIKLELQPLDIVLFCSNIVYHKTTQHLSDQAVGSDVAECWAITCFFHKAIEQHMEPSIQNIFHYVAKVHSDTQQGEGSQKQGEKRQKQ